MENEKPSNPRLRNLDGQFAYEARQEDFVSLRDEIAMRAMQGICADGHTFWDSGTIQGNPLNIARLSFEIADMMLKIREETK